MINKLQELIKEMEDDSIEARKLCSLASKAGEQTEAGYFAGRRWASIEHIQKLKQILNGETAKDLSGNIWVDDEGEKRCKCCSQIL